MTVEHPAIRLERVSLRRDGRDLLRDIDWTVEADERWVVLGANGSGKTSLIRIAALYEHPSSGKVEILGERLGRTDVRSTRRRVSMVSAAMVDLVRRDLPAETVVMCAKHAALEPWWHTYDDEDAARARHLLDDAGLAHVVGRSFGTLSSGERQRVLLARALMPRPELLLLDEPCAGLDLGGREELVDSLSAMATSAAVLPMVLVTHHVEEIPPEFSHALVIRRGTVLAKGAIDDVLDGRTVSEAFGVDVVIDRHADGRFSARRR